MGHQLDGVISQIGSSAGLGHQPAWAITGLGHLPGWVISWMGHQPDWVISGIESSDSLGHCWIGLSARLGHQLDQVVSPIRIGSSASLGHHWVGLSVRLAHQPDRVLSGLGPAWVIAGLGHQPGWAFRSVSAARLGPQPAWVIAGLGSQPDESSAGSGHQQDRITSRMGSPASLGHHCSNVDDPIPLMTRSG